MPMNNEATWLLLRNGRAPLAGRAAELRALDEALAYVESEQKPRIITLLGPAGIGKSRLVQEFVVRHRALRGAPVPRVYRGSARDAATAYGAIARLLRARFGLVEGMPLDDAKREIRAQVARVLDDRKVGDVCYYLGQLLGLTFEESPLTKALDDDAQQARIVRRAILKSFFEADAAAAPICLVFEDLHLAHDDSLALVRYLLEYLSGPLLLVCCARSELLARHDDWPLVAETRHEVVDVAPLSDDAAGEVLRALLAPCEGGPPEALVESALSYAGGVPILLEQMVRIFHDTGVLEEHGDPLAEPQWRVHADRLATVKLPLTVEEAVEARLAALEEDERQLLEQAAVMGGTFYAGALRSLARLDAEGPPLWTTEVADREARSLDMLLEGLVERGYVAPLAESSLVSSKAFSFQHARERELLRTRTNAAAAKRYHRAVADWLDHQPRVHEGEELLTLLASHRERAGDATGAGLAYLEAGDRARSRYANGKAAELYEKGLTLLGDAKPGRRIDALHNAGDVLQMQGRHEDALASFREMLALAYRLDLKHKGGAAHNRIGRLYRDVGTIDEATKHLTTALELFQAAGDERGVASTTDDIGKLHWLKGEYQDALLALREGLTRRRRLADRRGIALSLNNVGLVLADSGELGQALEVFEQSLGIRREIGDLPGIIYSLLNLGDIALGKQDLPTAKQFFVEALEVSNQVGDRNRVALVLTSLGAVACRAGRPQEAIEHLRQAEAMCDELGDKLVLAEALRGLGKSHLLVGDLVKARDYIGRAVDLFAAVRSKVHLGLALRTLGEITAAGGWGSAHSRSAGEYFARSAAMFEQTGSEMELARTLRIYAAFLRSNPDFDADPRAQAEARRMEERAERTFARIAAAPLPRASFSSTPPKDSPP